MIEDYLPYILVMIAAIIIVGMLLAAVLIAGYMDTIAFNSC